nr:MAG TPA: hypothetical protein [Bacteriophage sp.]
MFCNSFVRYYIVNLLVFEFVQVYLYEKFSI